MQPVCDRRSQRQLAQSWQVRQQSPYHVSVLFAFCTLYLPRIFIEHRHWGVRSPVVLTRHVSQGTRSRKERFSRKTHKYFCLSLVPRYPWSSPLQIMANLFGLWCSLGKEKQQGVAQRQPAGTWPGVTSKSPLIMFLYKHKGHLPVT